MVVDALLEQRPDLHMATGFLVPFVTERTPLDPATWRALPAASWTELGSETQPDGTVPGLADATAVASYVDSEAEVLWIRFSLTAPPVASAFGDEPGHRLRRLRRDRHPLVGRQRGLRLRPPGLGVGRAGRRGPLPRRPSA